MKFIRIDMTDQRITVTELPEKYFGLGGRGLTSIMINDEVPPLCDPLGPENKLIFAPGILSGTPLVNTSRISVGAKSPLTGGIKESNAGGKIGAAVARLGIAAIVIEGKAPEGRAFLLCIDKDGVPKLIDASPYKGMRTYPLCAKLIESFGSKNAIMCIGPAGELELASASIQSTDVDDRPCRAAGRGGLGAVMGAKGVKAIIVSTEGDVPSAIADRQAFMEAARSFAQALRENVFTSQILPAQGTASTVAAVNALGAFPCYNATKGVFDGWEKISGEALAETIKKRGGKPTHQGCTQCIIQCSNEYVDEGGRYLTASLEYETIWAMGGMLGIADLDAIARLDSLCDDLGLDTMNTGVAIAVAMDAGYRPFGDGQAAIAMIEEVLQGTEVGKAIGNGPDAVGRYFKHHRIPAVKRQGIAAYDPRGMQGNGVTYATSPMGADHTAGNLLGTYLAGKLNPLAAEGQVEASRRAQISMAALDATGLCLLAAIVMTAPAPAEAMYKMLGAKLGRPFTAEDYTALGMRILKAEREFNQRAGFTKDDDRLPRFFKEEPLPPHNAVFLIKDEELDEVYNF